MGHSLDSVERVRSNLCLRECEHRAFGCDGEIIRNKKFETYICRAVLLPVTGNGAF